MAVQLKGAGLAGERHARVALGGGRHACVTFGVGRGGLTS
jgi:hypothetical protein